MRKIHVNDYAAEQGVTSKTVYDWVSKGKVRHIKEKGERHTTTYILVDEPKNDVTHQVKHGDTMSEQNISSQVQPVQDTKEILEFMREMTEYIELAGQARLLSDSERQTKEHYFELTQENKLLIKENTKLEIERSHFKTENQELKLKLEQLQEKFKGQEEENKKQGIFSILKKI